MPFSWSSSPAFWGIVDARYGHGVLVRSRTVTHLHVCTKVQQCCICLHTRTARTDVLCVSRNAHMRSNKRSTLNIRAEVVHTRGAEYIHMCATFLPVLVVTTLTFPPVRNRSVDEEKGECFWPTLKHAEAALARAHTHVVVLAL